MPNSLSRCRLQNPTAVDHSANQLRCGAVTSQFGIQKIIRVAVGEDWRFGEHCSCRLSVPAVESASLERGTVNSAAAHLAGLSPRGALYSKVLFVTSCDAFGFSEPGVRCERLPVLASLQDRHVAQSINSS